MKTLVQNPALLTWLLVLVALFAVVFLVVAVALVMKSRKKTEEEEKEEAKADKPGQLPFIAVSGMRESFREALKRLREKHPGWNSQYKAPWYLLVGETGSGKSEVANQVCGLSAEIVEGGEDNCAPRWLLLDHAVLIDLPGKAFLQDDDAASNSTALFAQARKPSSGGASVASDRGAWKSFLRLTARYRPRQPLNGIVLTIPAQELLDANEDQDDPRKLARLAALAQRLDDVQQVAGISLPVYLLVTKCDVVPGFGSYCGKFMQRGLARRAVSGSNPKDEIRDDLFGWSNPHALDSEFSTAWVDEAFLHTNEVLLGRQLEMLAQTETTAAADGVFQFPFELQRMQTPMRALLNLLFRTTAYHSSHLLRGIYFCGRVSQSTPLSSAGVGAQRSNESVSRTVPGASIGGIAFVRNLFEFKVFAERYLAIPATRSFFSRNRSVLIAQIVACVLAVFLTGALIHEVGRIRELQNRALDPILLSLATTMDTIAAGSGGNMSPAGDILSTIGAARDYEFYSLTMPISLVDIGGVHRKVRDALGRIFEIVILRSCENALEARIDALMTPGAGATAAAANAEDDYPPGTAWSEDAAYRRLYRYLSNLRALQININRYHLISGSDSGSFKQLNALLHYLGAKELPDSSRFAKDPEYQRLLLQATWKPLQIPARFDQAAAANTNQLIADFYRSWFDANPLVGEVQGLAGKDGLQALSGVGATPSNVLLRSIVSRAQSMDNQLKGGSYDWVAGDFNRMNYPALGTMLDEMPFADSQFTDGVTNNGNQKLAGLRTALKTTLPIVDVEDGKTRLSGPVNTLSSVLEALLGYELMDDDSETSMTSEPCGSITGSSIWNQADLYKAQQIDSMRKKIEGELLPGLPGEYRDAVQNVVDRRAAVAIFSRLRQASAPLPAQEDNQAALDAQLQNLSQSVDKLKQIEDALSGLHATAAVSCLKKTLVRQSSALLLKVNQQLPGLYSHGPTVDGSNGDLPVSQWMYGVASADDLQAYLAAERQKIETLSADAAPLVQLLRTDKGHPEVLTKWRNISQDVDALQAKKAGNPIQTLEAYISTELDKITPENSCKAAAVRHSPDVFLSVRADLAQLAVDHCQQVAIQRFNEIAVDFNRRLAGHFPFSQQLDTRPGSEAAPEDIAEFYQTYDRVGSGLSSVLANASEKPGELNAFLKSIAMARPLVLGGSKDPNPVLGATVRFRTNRSHEIFGDRIAGWSFQVGQQSINYRQPSDDVPLLVWQFGDPVTLAVRYANNAPEMPAKINSSIAAQVKDGTVIYRYSDPWSLFALLRDHPPTPVDAPNQYAVSIPNVSSSSADTAKPSDTVVYLQIDLLPAGAKAGGATLPLPAFPYLAPTAARRSVHGD